MAMVPLNMSICTTILCIILFSNELPTVQSLQPSMDPKGSAARPMAKKNVAVLGGGGTLGAMTFGFLQRSASLFSTGIGKVRCIGATSDTAVRLNRVLGQKFCLGFADETFIKLTNLEDAEEISGRLENGWDALIWGTDLAVQTRPVTGGTFETTPNSKTVEVYLGDSSLESQIRTGETVETKKQLIVDNILTAAKSQKLSHMVVVDDGSVSDLRDKLNSCGIPYTCLQPTGALNDVKGYTYREGIQGELTMTVNKSGAAPAINADSMIPREDIAALAVECLQSLDWSQSRFLTVSCNGNALDLKGASSGKRPDQEWCVNSFVLRNTLMSVSAQSTEDNIFAS